MCTDLEVTAVPHNLQGTCSFICQGTRLEDSEVTFSVFESSYHLQLTTTSLTTQR